jgi:anthranilate synthase/aminodeoxychorismate synthase-like glutamine amidotransferase|tara:strand:+ start:2515 stop:3093 length:579 start_codon:yes stop_codon:yes gene_type:complete
MKILLIDNLGFTHNLIDEFEKKGCEVISYRNDVDIKVIDSAVNKFKPNLIVISSGPENISNAGNSVDIIRSYAGSIPIFGVGFGCECIIEAFEGKINRSSIIMHGKITLVDHDGKTIFKNINNPFNAGAFNSLSALDVPYDLEVSARSQNDIVMGIRHKECFVEGIQFNPGSILTKDGSLIIGNVLKEAGKK